MKYMIIFLLSMIFTEMKASDSTSQGHFIQKLYISGGIGSGLMASGSALFKGNHFCSFHYINEIIIVAGKAGLLESNVTKTYECYSLTYGKGYTWKFVYLNASIGPSYVIYDEPINITLHTNWWDDHWYTYDMVRHKLPGIFLNAQVNFFPINGVGLGVEAYANINKYNAPSGIIATISFGLLKRQK